MQRVLLWLLQKYGIAIEEDRHLPLGAIRELVYRLQTIIITLGLVAGGVYNSLYGFVHLLLLDVALGLLLLVNTWEFFRTRRKLLPPLPLLLLAYWVLAIEVVFANAYFIYFCAVFPVAGYLAVENSNLGRLNFFWFAISTVLALYSLSFFDAIIFSSSLACVCMFLEMIFFILRHHEGELKYLATRDFLTDSLNRRAMEEAMANALLFMERYGQSASIVMLDIDRFKEVNDTYGHGEGDSVLVNLAEYLASRLRGVDRVCRYGGEEFVLILPNTHLAQAYRLAQRLREEIGQTALSDKVAISVSCGVAEMNPGESVRGWLDRCDRALYRAKQNGRNCVEAAGLVEVA